MRVQKIEPTNAGHILVLLSEIALGYARDDYMNRCAKLICDVFPPRDLSPSLIRKWKKGYVPTTYIIQKIERIVSELRPSAGGQTGSR